RPGTPSRTWAGRASTRTPANRDAGDRTVMEILTNVYASNDDAPADDRGGPRRRRDHGRGARPAASPRAGRGARSAPDQAATVACPGAGERPPGSSVSSTPVEVTRQPTLR